MRVRNNETDRRAASPLAECRQTDSMSEVFAPGRWVWTRDERKNQFVAFVRSVDLPAAVPSLDIRISASYHYELYINGSFVNRGPVHGDPRWCHYDDLHVELDIPTERLDVLVVVHHPTGTHIHCLTPAPGGLICQITAGSYTVGSDGNWRCKLLPMWNDKVKPRNSALGYCEDYDARLEPRTWDQRRVPVAELPGWTAADPVENPDESWGGYQPRITPLLTRRLIEPQNYRAFRAPGKAARQAFDVSETCDRETLIEVRPRTEFSLDSLNADLAQANAVTFDLGKEYVGFYSIDLEAPGGTVLDISGAELLQPDEMSGGQCRPWIYRKGTCYSARYTCRTGRQAFVSFSWTGCRYVHLVVRSTSPKLRIHSVGLLERAAGLTPCRTPQTADRTLKKIVAVCQRTLQVTALEHVVDCPTREQAPAFADGLVAASALLEGFCEPSYLLWYLEAILRAPLNEYGQFCGRYPSTRGYWLDFCLLAFQMQRRYRRAAGHYYKPVEALARGLEVKRWFDARRNDDGIVDFPFDEYYRKELRNFVDHPGLGMHDSPHPGIDRDGASCPLNSHFYAFLRVLAHLAEASHEPDRAYRLLEQARNLREAIRAWFFDGHLFHDARKHERLSPFTSWQTNGMAVFYDLAEADECRGIMTTMLERYDDLCRCTPYSHFYFLPALDKAGMRQEAIGLIKHEWGRMIQEGATTTWEGFEGNAKDSLCQPWSTTPLLFLLDTT